MTPKFELCVAFVLLHEGGYNWDPDDPGGETNYGIAKKFHPMIDIKSLTVEGAKKIYFDEYWTPYQLESLDSIELAKRVFDFSVTSYITASVRALQNALNLRKYGLALDGRLGPLTVRAANESTKLHEEELVRAFCFFRGMYYKQIANPRFERGWLLRAMA